VAEIEACKYLCYSLIASPMMVC